MTNLITNSMDYQMTVHWCNAVRTDDNPNVPFVTLVHEHVNILQYAQAQDTWFTPDRDPHTNDVIQNERLEQFRLACLYDATSNLLDIGENLDDDVYNTTRWLKLLTEHAGTGEPSNLMWLFKGDPMSITMRTLRF